MQALFELTEGQKRLASIVSAFPAESPHWNEAQNRFQFIDRLLIECLGWEPPYISVEDRDALGGKADYVLGNPAKAILEAKREAQRFNVPPIGEPHHVRKMQPLLKACKNFEQAVEQVIPYCAMRGAQIAIVCNGPQLAIFQTMIVGQSPLEGECFFFDGLESYLENFPLLWSLLSPEGINENRAYRDLSLHRNPRIPPKASIAIPEPTKWRYRSQFQENLRLLASLLLEEVEDNPLLKNSFYKECYVPIDANNRHLLLSKNIIAARYKRVGDDGAAPIALDAATSVDAEGDFQINDPTLAMAISSRPVVVIGDVGVGKTSFFENLFEHLDVSEQANTYFIHVDLGVKANLASDVKSFVMLEIPTILKRRYNVDIEKKEFVNSIYHEELKDFDASVRGALKSVDPTAYEKERIDFLKEKVGIRDAHLHASLGHLAKGRNKQIILVMDNADQRTFEIQQQAFLIAQELAATRNLLVFVALRPSTFYQSKITGTLSGYQNKVLTIAPPPADEVLERRITFAVRVAEGKIAPATLKGIRLHLKSIVLFLHATLRSIRTNELIRQFLSNITGGNTRLVIELVTGFCGSPNVDSEKIVKIEEQSGDYRVPLHEFTKHALLGDYAYFNPLSSVVGCNIFDVSSADPREHFLASLIIAYVSSSLGIKDNDGFVSGSAIVTEMTSLGFFKAQTQQALRRIATKRLIETPHAHYREIPVLDSEPPEQFHYRATSIGVYHVRFWTGAFTFLDATATDTPIFDVTARDEVIKLAASFDTADRYNKAVCFKQYLERQWQASNLNTNYYDLEAIFDLQGDSFKSVETFINRGGKTGRKPRR
jgi:GTPase SAR1 family protein